MYTAQLKSKVTNAPSVLLSANRRVSSSVTSIQRKLAKSKDSQITGPIFSTKKIMHSKNESKEMFSIFVNKKARGHVRFVESQKLFRSRRDREWIEERKRDEMRGAEGPFVTRYT